MVYLHGVLKRFKRLCSAVILDMYEAKILEAHMLAPLLDETNQLISIFTASVKRIAAK